MTKRTNTKAERKPAKSANSVKSIALVESAQRENDEQFISDLKGELIRAREKFPNSKWMLAAMTEEVGELAKAVMEEDWERVHKEAVQVACTAVRLATEGDISFAELRIKNGLSV